MLLSIIYSKETVEVDEEKPNKGKEKEIKPDFKSFKFGNEKNPDLSGDFEIKVRIGQQKLKAWFNVPFLIQIAHLSKPCELENNVWVVDEKDLKVWCNNCRNNYYHYQFLHVEKCIVLNDPLDVSSWEKKIYKIEEEEDKCFEQIDVNINATVKSLNSSKKQDNNYLFSSYLGSINQKKNILLNKIDTIINAYDSESKKTKYELTLNHGDFSKQKPVPNKKIVFYFQI